MLVSVTDTSQAPKKVKQLDLRSSQAPKKGKEGKHFKAIKECRKAKKVGSNVTKKKAL